MTQTEEKSIQTPEESLSTETGHNRLQALVSELLRTNQELRFKIARLEQDLSDASTVFRLLTP